MAIDQSVHQLFEQLAPLQAIHWSKVSGVSGNIVEAKGLEAGLGALCSIEDQDGHHPPVLAEVVAFEQDTLKLIPYHETIGLSRSSKIRVLSKRVGIHVNESLLGRVINPLGDPLDGGAPISYHDQQDYVGAKIPPLQRAKVNEPLDVGVRAINSLLTLAKGQRVGLIAGSGVGKSTLMGMITKHTEADIVILGLIGERGREANEFIEETLGAEGMAKSIVVLATSDSTAVMRRRGAEVCHILAEYFRDQGRNVLLLCDSLTRIAHAQREIGLAIGEPPTNKGYPPSTFNELPKMMERGGMGRPGQGSITSIYTVLSEHDAGMDPIVEVARATLDGQIMLSRHLADASHYPAIDLNGSISRIASKIIPQDCHISANTFRRLWSLYEQNRDILNVGAYKKGSNPELDMAIKMRSAMTSFARQEVDEISFLNDSLDELVELMDQAISNEN